jgi:hypothetical protein
MEIRATVIAKLEPASNEIELQMSLGEKSTWCLQVHLKEKM